MDLSICILTHNQPELLPLCVTSCFEEINRAGVDGEVVVIDNASVDRYPEKLAQVYPHIRIIRNEQNLSFSAANNRGILASAGGHILILNDDAILESGCLKSLINIIESDTSIGVAGPKILNPDGTLQTGSMHDRLPHVRGIILCLLRLNTIFERYEWTRKLFTLARNPSAGGKTQQVIGACMLIRRDALMAVGMFDERYHYLLEDDDLCCQIQRRGWQIFYVPEASVIHYGSSSFKAWSNTRFLETFIDSVVYYFAKNANAWRNVLLRVLLILTVGIRMFAVALRDAFSHKDWVSSLRGHLEILRELLWSSPRNRQPMRES